MSATPATQNDRGCAIVPRLPREIKVDVTKCHACHKEVARRHGRHGRLNQDQARHPPPSAMSEAPATQNDRGCAIVPRLPREIEVAPHHGRHGRLNQDQARHPVP